MINRPAIRITAAFVLLGGLAIAPLLEDGGHRRDTAGEVAVPQAPRFQIRWQQNHLLLSGHTVSKQHEHRLLQVIDASYRNALLSTQFEPLGIVPASWEDTTIQVLFLLAESDSSVAEISAEMITIRAVSGSDIGWNSRLGAVRDILPSSIVLSVDTLEFDRTINVAGVCDRAFKKFDVGAVNFEESSAEFLSSAYPRLDRVVALANVCSKASVHVAGHTDLSGSEPWNNKLSLQRASAVADYIIQKGVNADRLRVSGFGSTMPIADNTSRYGRSRNRRIEIEFGP